MAVHEIETGNVWTRRWLIGEYEVEIDMDPTDGQAAEACEKLVEHLRGPHPHEEEDADG